MKSCNTIDYIVTEDETEFKIGLDVYIGLSCSVAYYFNIIGLMTFSFLVLYLSLSFRFAL